MRFTLRDLTRKKKEVGALEPSEAQDRSLKVACGINRRQTGSLCRRGKVGWKRVRGEGSFPPKTEGVGQLAFQRLMVFGWVESSGRE